MGSAKKKHPKVFIQHKYNDRSEEPPTDDADVQAMRYFSASTVENVEFLRFPLKLHKLLLMAETVGYDYIISW
jgi:hypothetical protein